MQLSGAAILTLILVIVALSPRLSRLSTWYSFCLSWILSSLSYCLLYISGQQTRPEPEPGLCVFQSGLIYAAPVLWVPLFALQRRSWSDFWTCKELSGRHSPSSSTSVSQKHTSRIIFSRPVISDLPQNVQCLVPTHTTHRASRQSQPVLYSILITNTAFSDSASNHPLSNLAYCHCDGNCSKLTYSDTLVTLTGIGSLSWWLQSQFVG